MILQRLQLLTTLVMSSLAAAAGTQPQGEDAPTGLLSDVVFTEYSPLSGGRGQPRRRVKPLSARALLLPEPRVRRHSATDMCTPRALVYYPAPRATARVGSSVGRAVPF